MKKTNELVLAEIEEVGTETLATSIVRLSDAAEKLLNSGLTLRAICLLLKDSTQVPIYETQRVLTALPQLKKRYVLPVKAKKG